MSQNDLKLWWGSALTPVRAKTRSERNLIILVSDDHNQYHSCTTLRINPWHFLLSNLYHHNVNINHHICVYRVRSIQWHSQSCKWIHRTIIAVFAMFKRDYWTLSNAKILKKILGKTRFTVQLIRWKIDNSNFLDFCASSWIVEDY